MAPAAKTICAKPQGISFFWCVFACAPVLKMCESAGNMLRNFLEQSGD
jgi:hypothetical protein